MFGLETLDILIGLVTIYLAFAVACTACVEANSAGLGIFEVATCVRRSASYRTETSPKASPSSIPFMHTRW